MSYLDTLNVKCINELAIREKRVFIRTDFNIPIDEKGVVTDINRIELTLPTIKHALEHNARVIIASHSGRPEGGNRDAACSLEPVAAVLAELLEKEIFFFEDCVGMGAQQMVRDLKPGHILVLENLRFSEDERKNSSSFARELAKMCDVYINDAFGVSHRKEASVYALPQLIDTKGMGFLMKHEIEELSKLIGLKRGDRFYSIIGGSKIADKISIIRPMLEVADRIMIGGEMAYTFLAAKGIRLGNSRVEEDRISVAREIIKGAEARGVELILPVDHIAAADINSTETVICSNSDFPEGMTAFDIGPETLKLYIAKLEGCRELFWNGPVGVFEHDQFAKGSIDLARAVVETKAHTVAGGGESAALMKKAGVKEKFSHISTGGGASLEFLRNNTLPGIDVLR
ncbi:MAG TPA: phosphoglycerate kinase [bacterium]|nr:phosphoglycerate kinase [bacterium]HPS31004.1 phosphoglycerate kinase [bacterium]